jgi:hypothetical protein
MDEEQDRVGPVVAADADPLLDAADGGVAFFGDPVGIVNAQCSGDCVLAQLAVNQNRGREEDGEGS